MICTLCPRRCRAERTPERGGGFCQTPAGIFAARAMLHLWEEPCLTGEHGAGCVFFTGCNLGCVYCQNRGISSNFAGKSISAARLRSIFDDLIRRGAACIDLVTGSHIVPWLLEALEPPLPVPVVWNSSAYESVETLRLLDGKVQVYLPDLKYADAALSASLSAAPDYFDAARAAIDEMFRQTGPCRFGEDGLLKRGVLIRHLVLPGQIENTRRVIDYVASRFAPGEVLFSLMSQYTPQPGLTGPLARRLTGAEYRSALAYLDACGLTDGYVQEKSSAKEEYTPSFDMSGL